MSSPERLLQNHLLAGLPTQPAWPEGVIGRYLTVGGATVDATYTVWTCAGCDDTSRGKYTNPWRIPFTADEIKGQAQSHAATCRAMPKPGVAR